MIEQDVGSFVRGYLNVRGQSDAEIEPRRGAILVTYQQPFKRRRELFAWQIDAARAFRFLPGDCITLMHTAPLGHIDWLPAGFAQTISEFFMSAALPLRIASSPETVAQRIADPSKLNSVEAFSLSGRERERALDAVNFAASIEDRLAATGRYGLGKDGDIVVDRMLTLPEYRRRGLATSLLSSIDADAQKRGRRRALLIASQQGRPLYEAIGFIVLAQVSVFAESPPA